LLIGEEGDRLSNDCGAGCTPSRTSSARPVPADAIAGIDIALWDLLGKAAGWPV